MRAGRMGVAGVSGGLAKRLGVTLLLAMTAGHAAAQQSAGPPAPAPGQLVDIGGWRLHLHCMGTPRVGQPTVILDSGMGDFSVEWSLVQPRVAEFARVCSYDRAGSGWSDLGPRPRTRSQLVWELHTLLEKAGVRPPFVMVGHSYGGPLVRMFAHGYPNEVIGMVLVDGGHERGLSHINGQLVRLAEQATGRPIPQIKTANPLREADIPEAVRTQIAGAARFAAQHANDPPRDRLPADAQRMRAWALGQVKLHASNDNPFDAEELAALVAQRQKDPLFNYMPLIVLTSGRSAYPADQKTHDDERRAQQTDLLGLSRCSKQVIAPNSDHHIQLDAPELVVAAISDILARSVCGRS